MAVEYFAYGWLIGSLVLALVVLYFTRLAMPISRTIGSMGTCEICYRDALTKDNHGLDVCSSCEANLLPKGRGHGIIDRFI